MTNEAFLRRRDVEKLVGLRRSAIYARIAAGTFPRPINLSARCVAWLASEIEEWQERQISASRTQVA